MWTGIKEIRVDSKRAFGVGFSLFFKASRCGHQTSSSRFLFRKTSRCLLTSSSDPQPHNSKQQTKMAEQDTTMSLVLLGLGGLVLVGGVVIYFVLKRRLKRPRKKGNRSPPQMGFGAPPPVPMKQGNAPPPPLSSGQGGPSPFSGGPQGPPPGMGAPIPEGREFSGNGGGGGGGAFVSPAPAGASFFNQVRQSFFGGNSLPPGWKSSFDKDTGDTYYYNKSTGQVQWTPP